MIAGFVLEGGSAPVLLRAVGPALVDFGVPDFLRDPQLTLFAGESPLGTNDQWSLADDAAGVAVLANVLGGFPLRVGSSDAALRTTLAPGTYTMHGAPAPGLAPGGSLLVEVYTP